MKKYEVISIEELAQAGWVKMCGFGNSEVWAMGNERMLYDPKTKLIILLYVKDDIKDETILSKHW